MFKQLVKKLIGIVGYKIVPFIPVGEFPELRRLRQREIHFKAVINVGASDRHWSAPCMKQFPDIDLLSH